MIFALDPLFLGDAGTLEVVLIVILKVLVAFGVCCSQSCFISGG